MNRRAPVVDGVVASEVGGADADVHARRFDEAPGARPLTNLISQ